MLDIRRRLSHVANVMSRNTERPNLSVLFVISSVLYLLVQKFAHANEA